MDGFECFVISDVCAGSRFAIHQSQTDSISRTMQRQLSGRAQSQLTTLFMTRIIILDSHLSGTKSDETKEKVFEIESRTSDTCIAMVWAGGVPCTPVI